MVKMIKTKHKFVSIPIIPQAKYLLYTNKSENPMPVLTNQKCNKHLKGIADHLGIAKVLTFHTSRHTFATISLNLGMLIEAVSKMLGHTKITTTQIYAKMQNETLIAAMHK